MLSCLESVEEELLVFITYQEETTTVTLLPLTSNGAEGVEVLGGEQGCGQFPDELLKQRSSVIWTHLIPREVPRGKVCLQVLLQQLQTQKTMKLVNFQC